MISGCGAARARAAHACAPALQARTLRNWSRGRQEARFQFKCTACGKCCTGSGGRVRVNKREVAAIATLLRSSPTDVETRFLRRLAPEAAAAGNASDSQPPPQWVLQQTPDDAQCVFLDGSKCSIYKARPTQCRTYPWWPQNLISDYDWQLAARECEGIVLPREEDPGDALPESTAAQAPNYSFDDILPEVVLHDIHRSGENFTYEELEQMIADLQEVDEGFVHEYKTEFFQNYSRRIVHRDDHVTVLDTFLHGAAPTRCFVFNDRIHLVQSEVALASFDTTGGANAVVDRSSLMLDVHRAMCIPFAALESAGSEHDSRELQVAVIGSGAASLPLFLLEHANNITRLDTVEPSAAVNSVARAFFGLAAAEERDHRLAVYEITGEAFVDEQLHKIANGSAPYDLILLDVESGDWDEHGVKAPPASMLSPTFLSSVRALLAPSGALVVNVITENRAALERVERTFANAFPSGGVVVELSKNAVFILAASSHHPLSSRSSAESCSVGGSGDVREHLASVLSRDSFQSQLARSPDLVRASKAARRLRGAA